MISAFIAPGLPAIVDAGIEPANDGGFPRAAFRLPSGVEEAVMLDTVAAGISEALRGEAAGRTAAEVP